jgi:hypothetical protein
MSKITVFKTTSGLDYIGKLVGENDREYQVEDMLALVPQQDGQGQQKIGMGGAVHPAMGKTNLKANGAITVPLNRSVVLFPYEPTDQLEDAYTQSVTGIQIATSMPKSRM